MADLLFKEESYKIIGACFEVHKILGHGFKEAVYKDALEFEFEKNQHFLFKGNSLYNCIQRAEAQTFLCSRLYCF